MNERVFSRLEREVEAKLDKQPKTKSASGLTLPAIWLVLKPFISGLSLLAGKKVRPYIKRFITLINGIVKDMQAKETEEDNE